MDLIAKGKILDYITAHPESQTSFLTFLKEYEHEFKKRFEQADGFKGSGVGSGAFSLGTGDFIVEYENRAQLNANCITWVGNKQENQAYHNERRRMMRHTYGEKLIVEHVVITVSKGRERIERTVVPYDATEPVIVQPAASPAFDVNTYQKVSGALKSNFEYEQALARANSIFGAEPQTLEFAELESLITSVKIYEARHVKFPELNLLDVVNHRMAAFGMLPEYLTRVFGTPENADLFFAGKKQLAKGALKKLFKILGIKIPVDEFL